MRVLFVIDSLHSGGAQQQLVRVFNSLRARGVDARIVYYFAQHHFLPQIPAADHGRVVCLDAAVGARRLQLLRGLRAHIGAQRPDVVVSFLRGASILVGMLRASGLSFRWIASERSSRLDLDSPARRRMYATALRLADLVAPNSHTVIPELQRCGVALERLRWLPNGIELPDQALATTPREPAEPLRLLAVGTLLPYKNYLPMMRALAALKDRAWVLDHLGRNDDDLELRASFMALVNEHGLSERVLLHGRRTDVARWYQNAHLLVHPSGLEGFPNVLLEAWAWACPVLVAAIGEPARLVRDGETGLVADVSDPARLRDALQRALDDPAALARMGAAGRQNVIDHFTMDAVADTWSAAIEDVHRMPGIIGRLGRLAARKIARDGNG